MACRSPSDREQLTDYWTVWPFASLDLNQPDAFFNLLKNASGWFFLDAFFHPQKMHLGDFP